LNLEGKTIRMGFMDMTGELAMPATAADMKLVPPEYGIEVVGVENLPLLGCIDSSREWMRLMKEKPDIVYLALAGNTLIVALKDAERLGARKEGMMIMIAGGASDPIISGIAGKKAGNHLYAVTYPTCAPTLYYEEGGMQMQIWDEYGRKHGYESAAVLPSAYTDCFWHHNIEFEAIRIAAEKVGVDNITGRDVRDALLSLKDFMGPFCITPVTLSHEWPFWASYAFSLDVIDFDEELGYHKWSKCTEGHRKCEWVPPGMLD
jgi:hypothetical protein